MVSGGVWIIARISGTTDKLSTSITHLGEGIGDLKEWLQKVDERTDVALQRIGVVETKIEERTEGGP
jgi:hypothetical protein